MPVTGTKIQSRHTKLWYWIPMLAYLCQVCGNIFDDPEYPQDELEIFYKWSGLVEDPNNKGHWGPPPEPVKS